MQPDTERPSEPGALVFNISAVERETGLSKDVLRIWERRYGFPKPSRDDNGERQYSHADVLKLRAMKRLMDVGMRPGRIIRSSHGELAALADARASARREQAPLPLEREILSLLKAHDAGALATALARLVMKQGLHAFVLDSMTLLNRAIGDAWMRGELQIFEEHACTEHLQRLLHAAIASPPRSGDPPRVLLTTLPDEQHGLGVLMVEALLATERVHCESLGTQTPVSEIVLAAAAHRVHVVALSFSSAFPARLAGESLALLRRQLPSSVELWAGGEMTRRVRRALPGVRVIGDLPGVLQAVAEWRTAHRAAS
jgi:DNA-binding transcriptional MerR regulator